jgi:hypothetical protein
VALRAPLRQRRDVRPRWTMLQQSLPQGSPTRLMIRVRRAEMRQAKAWLEQRRQPASCCQIRQVAHGIQLNNRQATQRPRWWPVVGTTQMALLPARVHRMESLRLTSLVIQMLREADMRSRLARTLYCCKPLAVPHCRAVNAYTGTTSNMEACTASLCQQHPCHTMECIDAGHLSRPLKTHYGAGTRRSCLQNMQHSGTQISSRRHLDSITSVCPLCQAAEAFLKFLRRRHFCPHGNAATCKQDAQAQRLCNVQRLCE